MCRAYSVAFFSAGFRWFTLPCPLSSIILHDFPQVLPQGCASTMRRSQWNATLFSEYLPDHITSYWYSTADFTLGTYVLSSVGTPNFQLRHIRFDSDPYPHSPFTRDVLPHDPGASCPGVGARRLTCNHLGNHFPQVYEVESKELGSVEKCKNV